jgi:hypothetical protein
MKDIIISMVVLSIIGSIARFILPRMEIFVKWLIKKFVTYAEKKVTGSSMGTIKKAKVIKWLKWFGIEASEAVDTFIDNLVDNMNSKGCNIKTDMQDEIVNDATNVIEKTTKKTVNKLIKKK